jgi:hypothetical protein
MNATHTTEIEMNTAKEIKGVLSYGMGVDSTAILLRWIEDPSSRPCDLDEILVITSMVGDEFKSTADDVAAHILPRLRAHGIRFVQVARAGLLEKDGITILDDSTFPEKLHVEGTYRLSEELRQAATIPTSGGIRKCSVKFKGWVLDGFLGELLGDASFDHVIGFNSEEGRRVAKDQAAEEKAKTARKGGKAGGGSGYGGSLSGRRGSYPLVEWDWDRAKCESYITEITGIEWKKSACSFCPFSGGSDECSLRYTEEPEGAAQAYELENVALRFNPRMKLFKTKSVASVLAKTGNERALDLGEELLDSRSWKVYELRRVMLPKQADATKRGRTERSVLAVIGELTRAEAEAELARQAAEAGLQVTDGRAVAQDTGEGFPRLERALVAAPSYVADKAGRYGAETFEKVWAQGEELLAG